MIFDAFLRSNFYLVFIKLEDVMLRFMKGDKNAKNKGSH